MLEDFNLFVCQERLEFQFIKVVVLLAILRVTFIPPDFDYAQLLQQSVGGEDVEPVIVSSEDEIHVRRRLFGVGNIVFFFGVKLNDLVRTGKNPNQRRFDPLDDVLGVSGADLAAPVDLVAVWQTPVAVHRLATLVGQLVVVTQGDSNLLSYSR